jgi:hypothetical protein
MAGIGDAVRDLNKALDQHFSIYCTNQEVHFDWLQSVEFQLRMYGSTRRESDLDSGVALEENHSCMVFPLQIDPLIDPVPRKRTRSLTVGSSVIGRVKFIGERESCEMFPGSLPRNYIPGPPALDPPDLPAGSGAHPDFSDPFSISLQDIPIPSEYPLTDDEDAPPTIADEEIYDVNPFEIHGKIIPLWARQEQVEKNLRNQARLNPDLIFRRGQGLQSLQNIFRKQSQSPDKDMTRLLAGGSSPRIPVHISRLVGK